MDNAKIGKTLEMLSALSTEMAEQQAATRAALQIVVELMLSQSPAQKEAVAEGIGQYLARQDLHQNKYLVDFLQGLHECACHSSRTTPDQRRSWMRLATHQASDES